MVLFLTQKFLGSDIVVRLHTASRMAPKILLGWAPHIFRVPIFLELRDTGKTDLFLYTQYLVLTSPFRYGSLFSFKVSVSGLAADFSTCPS